MPEDLRSQLGKREIRHSLGTSDLADAVVQEAQLAAKWKAEFRRLRAERVREQLADAPAIVERFLQRLSEDASGDLDDVIYGIQKLITVSLLTAWGPDEYRSREANLALGMMPEDDDWVNWQDHSLSDVVPETERDGLVARIRLLHSNKWTFSAGFREAIQHIKNGRRWDAVRFHILMIAASTGTKVPFPSEFYDAVAEAFVERLLSYRSYRWDTTLLGNLSPAPAAEPDRLPASPTNVAVPSISTWSNAGARCKPDQTLSLALERWKESMTPGESAITETTRSVERFVELFGDKHVAEITPNELFDYRDFLKTMPAGISLPAVRALGRSLRSHVEILHAQEADREAEAEKKGSSAPDLRRLSPQSVKKDVGGLSAIFSAVISERWILTNPAEKIPVDGYSKRRRYFLSSRA